jgi:hypothetical protein
MHTNRILYRGNQRYHVSLGPKRTTVSLDNFLSVLLSLKLGHAPETPQGQRAVRNWLQARLDGHGDHNRVQTSQWLSEEVIHALVSDELQELYGQWFDEMYDRDRAARQTASETALAATMKTG